VRISRRSRGSSIDRGSLARRYAARCGTSARRTGRSARCSREVEEFAPSSRSVPGLREVLEAGHVNRRDKQSALDQVLSKAGFLPSTKSFLALLVDKGRIERPPSDPRRIAAHGGGARGDRAGRSLRPHADVSPAERDVEGDARAPHWEEGRSGGRPWIPAVLGGLVVRVGRPCTTACVRTQIRQIRENLQEG